MFTKWRRVISVMQYQYHLVNAIQVKVVPVVFFGCHLWGNLNAYFVDIHSNIMNILGKIIVTYIFQYCPDIFIYFCFACICVTSPIFLVCVCFAYPSGVTSVSVDVGKERVLVESALTSAEVQALIEGTGRRAVLKGIGGSEHGEKQRLRWRRLQTP